MWFAPDGRRLLYVSFNDSTVEEQSYQWYGTIDDTNSHLYPQIKKVRYPKVIIYTAFCVGTESTRHIKPFRSHVFAIKPIF